MGIRDDERGFALTELIVAMTLMILILGATLATFEAFQKTTRLNQLQNDSQDKARTAIDRLARELRNAAVPTREQPVAIEVASAYELRFLAVDPAGTNARGVRRLRYCLGGPTDNSAVHRYIQTWSTAAPPAAPSGACGDTIAGTTMDVVANQIVNRVGGQNRPVWSANSTNPGDITAIRSQLFVDVNPGNRPNEARLASGVFLRNQNHVPVARPFSAIAAGQRRLLLNAWNSDDPDDDLVTYIWSIGGTEIGRGVSCEQGGREYCTAPATGIQTVTLTVTDPAGLEGTISQSVDVR